MGGFELDNRYRRVFAKCKALGVNPDTSSFSIEERRRIQAGIFISKLLRMIENGEYVDSDGRPDISAQPGYFFKWFAGPTSPSLRDTLRELPDELRFKGNDNPINPQKYHHCQKICELFDIGPQQFVENGLWPRMCSIIAYGLAQEFSKEYTKKEVINALGNDVAEYFMMAYKMLQYYGFEFKLKEK